MFNLPKAIYCICSLRLVLEAIVPKPECSPFDLTLTQTHKPITHSAKTNKWFLSTTNNTNKTDTILHLIHIYMKDWDLNLKNRQHKVETKAHPLACFLLTVSPASYLIIIKLHWTWENAATLLFVFLVSVGALGSNDTQLGRNIYRQNPNACVLAVSIN